MVKKLVVKKLKSVGRDSQLSATIRESAQQIWLAGLGAFAKAQEEGNKVFDALVREGETIQKTTRKVAEDKVTEMASKATGTWDKLEQVFENRVARSLRSLGVPSKDEVAALTKRVAELQAAVDKLGKAAKPKAAVAKPIAKPVAKPATRVASKAAARKPAAKAEA
ncbi:MAG: phasin family protein [Sulfuritalea sp.]|nr:phasin family protein [Sulfuritalea sp.]MDP1983459.1 phasin family protein [Sulfuritalea sp.]